jgi:DNA-binding GntR family transcriptional regulator
MRKATSKTKTALRATETRQPPALESESNLAEKAYQAILQGLFDRTIPAGGEFSQAELIRLLGITAQPLRDALRTLETVELSRSTYQFRSLIERAGARALAEMGDAAQIDGLMSDHAALLELLEHGELGPKEKSTLDALENRLHGALTFYLRNPLIETTARRLKNYLTLVRLDWLTTKPLAIRTLREHVDILRACAMRDADAAEAALAAHFQQALQRLLGMG